MTEVRRRRGQGIGKAGAEPVKPPMREALAQAAFELFTERGYEQTTVDDIVARAGVGRRSFFRYFPSKEDAVFPDHDRCLDDMTEFLTANPGDDPVAAVCDAARIVLRMYTANPVFSVQRYRLTRQVPGLRTYELSVVRRYEAALAGYLRRRFAGHADGSLRAEVVAAAVVAAHNNGLRSWLRSGGEEDPEAEVDRALSFVRDVWADAARTERPESKASGTGVLRQAVGGDGDGEVIVMVAPRNAPMWRVIQGIEATLSES